MNNISTKRFNAFNQQHESRQYKLFEILCHDRSPAISKKKKKTKKASNNCSNAAGKDLK